MPFIGLTKPREQVLAGMPGLGDQSPEARWLEAGKPSLVCFLRHTGCPFAEALVRQLSDIADQHPELNCVAVLHGEFAVAQRWLARLNVSTSVHCIVDTPRRVYGQWGVGYSNYASLLHPGVGLALLRMLVKGIRNRDASGTRWQQQVCFLVDGNSFVIGRHVPKHAGDVPDLENMVRLLE